MDEQEQTWLNEDARKPESVKVPKELILRPAHRLRTPRSIRSTEPPSSRSCWPSPSGRGS